MTPQERQQEQRQYLMLVHLLRSGRLQIANDYRPELFRGQKLGFVIAKAMEKLHEKRNESAASVG
jgi:hypothetical protein